MDTSTQKAEDIWWVFILVSLVLQILVGVLAPLRKRKKHKRFSRLITWLAYFLADWVAIFTLGLIFNGLYFDGSDIYTNPDILALWAPFLLLHLGGPDTITAFTLEDNELWLRHLLGLFPQLLLSVYVVWRTFPANKILPPVILVFIVGIVKYCERTWVLYQASSRVFSESVTQGNKPGPNYDILREQEMDVVGEGFIDHLDHIEMVQFAYSFFNTFKVLLVDVMLIMDDLKSIKRFFVRLSAKDAFKIIEIELNFMYDVLYTKAPVVHSRIGYVLRFISISSLITAFCLFDSYYKDEYRLFDMGILITYALLIAGMCFEAIGFFSLIFSDWSIVALRNYYVLSFIPKLHVFLFGGRRRWSQSIPQCSFMPMTIVECPKWMEKIVKSLCLKSILNHMRHMSRRPMTDDLKLLIFAKMKEKSLISIPPMNNGERLTTPCVLPNTSTVENFDESVLVLHVATELCYHHNGSASSLKEREICKVLSDYMFHLMVMQPTMIQSMGIWKIIHEDTCARLKELNQTHLLLRTKKDLRRACVQLLEVKEVRKKGSLSILPEAIELARTMVTERETIWEELSSKWVEMLCEAANRSKANMHAQHLGTGGELLTFIWLLMAHLGLHDHVMENQQCHDEEQEMLPEVIEVSA